MGRVTLLLIAANVVVYLLQQTAADSLVVTYALWPLGEFPIAGTREFVGFHWWQLVTSAFMHGTPTHLLFNMFGLFSFGTDVERVLGPRRYLAMYTAAILSGSLAQLVVVSMDSTGQIYPTVGASGGVFGVLLAFGMLFPRRKVMPMIPPIPMPAWVFVTLYGALELANGVLGTAQGIAHFAHLGGMVGAFAVLLLSRRQIANAPPPR